MKAKILIVDDEPSIRETLEAFLADAGHEVSTARSFNEAIAFLNETPFDLVVADIILGGKTGIDLLGVCRERKMSCVVVIITGAPTIDTAAEAVRLGAFDYLPKPVLKSDVLRVSGSALRFKEVADAAEAYRTSLETTNEQLQKALAEVKTLKGLLPICASCKNIRDDKGYWTKIESYICEHSDATFTHGLCPACAAKLYPELFTDPGRPA